jgi:glutathione S-transferase
MYALHYSPGAASMVVHAALLEAKVPHQLVLVDIEKDQNHNPDYLKLNPNGVVPTMIVDGKPMQESAAQLLLLAERHPEAGLAPPAGDARRVDWLKWTVHLSTHLGALYRTWFYSHDIGLEEHPPAVREALRQKIEATFDTIEAQLDENGPYLLGSEFSSVDLQLTMYVRWSRRMPRPATTLKHVNHLANLVFARDSWQKMREIEGLYDWAPAAE